MAKKFKHLREELNDKQKEEVNDLFSEPRTAERITGHVPGFSNHRQVIPFSDKHDVVITRHPHDVAGKSCHENIASCMTWGTEKKPHMPEAVFGDLANGTHEAFLVPKGDHELKNPIGRISLKPFHGKDSNYRDTGHTILRPESKVYGNNMNSSLQDEFKNTVKNWAHTHMPYHPGTLYIKDSGVYDDDGIDKKGHTDELWKREEYRSVLVDTAEHQTENIPMHDVLTNPKYGLHTKVTAITKRPSDKHVNTVLSTYGDNPGTRTELVHTALTIGTNIGRKKLDQLGQLYRGNRQLTSGVARATLISSSHTQKEKEDAYGALIPSDAYFALSDKRAAHPNLVTHILKRYASGDMSSAAMPGVIIHANNHGVLTDDHIEEFKRIVPDGSKRILKLSGISNKTVLGKHIERMTMAPRPIKEDAPANATGEAIPGSGNTGEAFPQSPPTLLRRKKFAKEETFVLAREDYLNLAATKGKKPYAHWESYLEKQPWAHEIREYANKNPKRPVIVECGDTGYMTYLRYGKK
jgi:hypothetical protein